MIAPQTNPAAPPPGLVDPSSLTPRQLEVLRFIDSHKYVQKLRGAQGWGLRGHAAEFSHATLDKLLARGLVRKSLRRGASPIWLVELTGAGLNTLAIADARTERRAQA